MSPAQLPSLLREWFDNHYAMGGWAGASYLDWNVVQPPINDIIKLLEDFKKVKEKLILQITLWIIEIL